jgi:hypothetical protein
MTVFVFPAFETISGDETIIGDTKREHSKVAGFGPSVQQNRDLPLSGAIAAIDTVLDIFPYIVASVLVSTFTLQCDVTQRTILKCLVATGATAKISARLSMSCRQAASTYC